MFQFSHQKTFCCLICYICNEIMRYITTILAFYVLILTVLPCLDVHKDADIHQNELNTNTSQSGHNDTDHCSPFCTCQCCSNTAVNHSFSIDFNCHIFLKKEYFNFKYLHNSSIIDSIWLPPKLS